MTFCRHQASERRKSRVLLMSVFCLLVSGCTLIRPPPREGWPDRSSIVPGEEITVGKNQNVYGIARKHGVSMRDVIVLNDLEPPFALKQGQRLVLPAKHQDYAPVPSAAPVANIEQAQLEPISPLPLSSQAVTLTPLEPPENRTSAQASVSILPPPPPVKPVATTVSPNASKMAMATRPTEPARLDRAPVSFMWPVQGPIVSEFGKKPTGTNNDGLNIAAPKGAPVVAAAGGMVAYAGNEMKGFGNLVLIRHEGGWVTAYAHLERMLVTKDSIVAAGDMIGTVGNTGGVSTPQLHFETRLDGKAVDPQSVIKKL